MTWLMWVGAVVAALVIAAVALRVADAARWADLMRAHTGELEVARANSSACRRRCSATFARFSKTASPSLLRPPSRWPAP